MNKIIRLLGLASIAASLIANAGCAAPSEPSAGELDEIEEVAAGEMALAEQSACHDDDEIDFSYTEIGPSQYRFNHRAPIDAPLDVSWEQVRDFSKFVSICLAGVATDFQWLDGGPAEAPSTCQFIVGGSTVVEEVTEVDEVRHILKYHVVEPVLGIQSYDSVVQIVRAPCHRSVLVWVTDVTLQPGVTVDALAALFETEPPLFKEYVESLNP